MQATSDVDSSEEYKLLIHSLTHEHTQFNGGRHLLLMQKWIRDNEEGILLRDLENVAEILKIVRSFSLSNSVAFRSIVTSILNLCSKPLLESKANERLRVKGSADMKIFYKAIAIFCLDADDQLKSEVVHCFRCIVNGGKDPLVLRADVNIWKSKGGNRVQITDTSFIQKLIRECDIIEFIVTEFLDSVTALERDAKDFEESSLLYTRSIKESEDKHDMLVPSFHGGKEKGKKNLREYGIPESVCEEKDNEEEGYEQEPSEEEKITCLEENNSNFRNNDNIENENIIGNEKKSEKVKSIISLKKEKIQLTLKENLTENLFQLCTELATESSNADIMCSLKICDGVVKFLKHLVRENFRDKRVSLIIDLLWTLLESYLDKNNNDYEKNKIFNENGESIIEDSIDLFDILDQESAVLVLGNIISLYAQDGFKNPDKVSRNEILAVLTILCESPSSHIYFIQSGLFNDLIYFVSYAECYSRNGIFFEWFENHPQSSSNPRNFATIFELDLYYKRGLWILISELLCGNNSDAIESAGNSPLLESLLFYLEYNTLNDIQSLNTSAVGISKQSQQLLQSQSQSRSLSQYQSTQSRVLGQEGRERTVNEILDKSDKNEKDIGGSNKDGNGDGKGNRGEGGGRRRDDTVESKSERNDLVKSKSSIISSKGYRSISRTTSEEDNEKKMKENNIENISQKNNQNYSQSFRTNNISTSFLQDKSILTQESKDINNNQFYNTKYSYNNQTNQMTSKNNKITSSTPLREKSFFETIPKIEILRLQVLGSNLLAETGAMFENQFLSINGPYRLYDIFYNYWESKEETHIMIISNLIIFLNRLLLRSDTIKNIMIELNIIQFCLLLFQYVDDESTKAQAVRAIALLCGNKNIICQTQFNELDGIKSIVLALKCCVGMRLPLVGLRAGIKISNKYSIDKEDPLLQPLGGDISVLSVAVLDCILQAIAGNTINESAFALYDGLDVLLELLETSPCVLRLQVLRLLSDLLENPDMVPHVRTWRSPKTMRSAAQLAACCWLDEEVRLGVARDDGVITNIMDPFGKHIWPVDLVQVPVADNASSASSVQTHTDASKSIAISRLSAAILHSRFSNDIPAGNVSLSMRKLVLEKDIRGVVASVLQLLGAFDIQPTYGTDIMNISGTYSEIPLDEDINRSSSTHTNSSVLRQNGQDKPYVHGIEPIEEECYANANSSSSYTRVQPSISVAGNRPQSPSNMSMGSSRSPFHPNHGSAQGIDGVGWDTSQGGCKNESDNDDSDFEFTVTERQVIAIARRYAILREGGWWREISDSLRKEGFHPIESDFTMIKAHLEIYFEASQKVQMEQMNLQELIENELIKTEKKFISQITNRINEDKKTAQLKQTTRAGRFRPINKN